MLLDGRNIPDNQSLRTEVCIIGGGPAGITIANEFINSKFEVILIESGGLKFDSSIQSLSEGKVVSLNQSNLQDSRRRQLGGNAHSWNAPVGRKTAGWRCLPLDSLDFESRNGIPNSGWPFKRKDLDPYYGSAHQVCGLGRFSYEIEDWQQPDAPLLFQSSQQLKTTISHFGHSSIFTSHYPQKIQQANNIKTLIYSTVLNIETDDAGQNVTNITVGSIARNTFKVFAKIFILATGGIENARLLLLSNSRNSSGLGNQHDVVGRFFMDHPKVDLGLFIPFSRQFLNRTRLYDIHSVNESSILGAISLKTQLLIQQQLPNHGIHFYPTFHGHLAQARNSLETIKDNSAQAKIHNKLIHHIFNILSGHEYITDVIFWKTYRLLSNPSLGTWSFLPEEKARFSALKLTCQLEQVPLANNRVVLNSEKDCLGQSKIELHWQLGSQEIDALNRISATIKQELEYSGLGYFYPEEMPLALDFQQLSGYHHLGTTRMHVNPKYGVVNPDCQVHGINNLFVAGSSVFPTGGYANPTLTIVALAIRLADKIKAVL
ncbi:MAG: GMC oxidoreductase [Cyanobacteria bacterium P01_G01_bin.67]